MQTLTFAAACKHYFGLHPGQTLQEFTAELKKLTPEDKAELIRLFPSVGIEIKTI